AGMEGCTGEEFRMHGGRFLRIVLVGHLMFAARGGDQGKTDEPLLIADRSFAGSREESGQLVELISFPDVAGMIVALGALNLNAQEDPRDFRRPLVSGIRAFM